MAKILIMAGGTGGHIMPGLAIAKALRSKGWEVSWLGNPERMEGSLVPAHGFEITPFYFNGVRGKGIATLLKLPFVLIAAFIRARKILKTIKPDVVLGMGGYISFPVGMMAGWQGIPLLIHEQNAVMGTANRILAKRAKKVLCGFPLPLPEAVYVGNPVREELMDVDSPEQRYQQRTGKLNVLVVGGSLGASALNETVPLALKDIPEAERPIVIHQAGKQHIEQLKQHYEQAGVTAECLAFIDDMKTALLKADVVICRAGAMSLAEISCVGVASLLVPLPNAIDDHQTKNAQYLVDAQAAQVIVQKDFTPEFLSNWLKCQDRDQLCMMAKNARSMSRPRSTEEIAAICQSVIKG
ncbi:undecaprenyldiphospho-muramoylpentapeptide beta-N-acetylglucosaminyltransferase [Basilea psittacipulmonis]|uniref:UDP-N-acetylglucosamine--N-acetylmuramyl-(pentapeptide) pyrophosphoryl-undecaprenol N-acetylglucosamine transferase n=1 Tax=Basilea psittacipulmonis DSM 24701 TaxID=1072685 RepID=A0A077DBV4_9BURK|nr:undecaprenyldiphospho-muramoylpentapeptide beta-N-acetylglucosaminyltransferase [Basilea psittacipulmonis]AIL32320.1 UDP-N-acetylglucosamine--N-acetylmuramyl-(pentapeptide) pyrophosphoryl-UDP N-acetylglucosamine transferase [Basilea psittacipulmonis DSM 24701]